MNRRKSPPPRRRRGGVHAVVWIAAAWAAACGDGNQITQPPPQPNQGPRAVGAIPAITVPAGESAGVDVSPYFSDPDGDALSYTASSSNEAAVGVSVSGASVTVAARARGLVTVTVAARDPHGLIAQQRFEVTVPNRGPEAAGEIPAQTVFAGETATLDASAWFRDPDGDALRYTATSSRTDVAEVSVAVAEIAIRALAPGVATVAVGASDAEGASAEREFQVTVPNRAPEPAGTIAPLTLPAGETAVVVASAYFTDADGESLSFAAASSNAGVAAVSVAGDSVTVTAVAKGLAIVTVTASDAQGEAAQQRFRVTVPNRAPAPVGSIPPRRLSAGETAAVDASAYFADADGDPLSYSASSSDAGVAAVSVSGAVVTVRAGAAGDATVTVTASDPAGLSASSAFQVTVAGTSPGFQIELVFATPVTAAREAVFRAAAERWMTILAPEDLADVRPRRALSCGSDPKFRRSVAVVDDVMIVVAVEEIDGRFGILGRAGFCSLRQDNLLPFYGFMEFDDADVERLERAGRLENVILHEMGHVLGIGTLWEVQGLLRNRASEDQAPDTHFTGRRAIAAFDEAGGAGYAGAKVPVENTGGPGTRNAHWREAVMDTEVMTGYSQAGREPLSAITVQSLADLGYTVDLSAADSYRLPSADPARAVEEAGRLPYGDDIWRGPIVVFDEAGRIVRTIPPR